MTWRNLFSRPKKDLEWIAELPHELDRKVLHNMIGRGTDLTQPREMIFTMYANSINSQRIKEEADSIGWHCSLTELGPEELIDPNSPTMNISIEIMRDNYIINEENFKHDSSLFDKLAKKYDSVCDGWYASSGNTIR